ncbi:TRAP transporter small permease [Rubrivivax albus]|uniref:TRAP transporter small permease protein n=1 Tax=Rubrivivax albus TaxID=2499835 RepID=A0A3S2TPI0_9BURK|nr:TRAP transporter small permease subunit [Rubrivivax albus]RVT49991.1 TRAP transporter small permease [Rubrivivax albus]
MRALEFLAKACALLAGLLLTTVTLMTCASLIGRNTTGWTIIGDFELTGVAAGAAIALFLPLGQLRRANIIVDFFTQRTAPATRETLDRVGAALLAAAMALLTWRSAVGGLSAWETKAETMMLGFPEWPVYAAIVPALALTGVIAAVQAVRGFGSEEVAA